MTDPLAPDREAARPLHPRPPGCRRDGAGVRKVPRKDGRRSAALALGSHLGRAAHRPEDFRQAVRTSAYGTGEPDTDSSRAAPAPRTAAPRTSARAVAGPDSGAAPGSVTGEPPACSNRTEPAAAENAESTQHAQRHLPPRRGAAPRPGPAGPPAGRRATPLPPRRRRAATPSRRGRPSRWLGRGRRECRTRRAAGTIGAGPERSMRPPRRCLRRRRRDRRPQFRRACAAPCHSQGERPGGCPERERARGCRARRDRAGRAVERSRDGSGDESERPLPSPRRPYVRGVTRRAGRALPPARRQCLRRPAAGEEPSCGRR